MRNAQRHQFAPPIVKQTVEQAKEATEKAVEQALVPPTVRLAPVPGSEPRDMKVTQTEAKRREAREWFQNV